MSFLEFNVGSISVLHKGAGSVAGAAGEGIKVMGAAETYHSNYHTVSRPSTEADALFYHRFSPPQISYEYLRPTPFPILHILLYLKYTPTPSAIASGKAFCFKSKLLNSFTQKERS